LYGLFSKEKKKEKGKEKTMSKMYDEKTNCSVIA